MQSAIAASAIPGATPTAAQGVAALVGGGAPPLFGTLLSSEGASAPGGGGLPEGSITAARI